MDDIIGRQFDFQRDFGVDIGRFPGIASVFATLFLALTALAHQHLETNLDSIERKFFF